MKLFSPRAQRWAPIRLLAFCAVLLTAGVPHAQVPNVTADVVGKVTFPLPADQTVAKATDLATANQKIVQLEGRVKALEADLKKVLDLEVLTNGGSRTIRSLIK